MVTVCDILDILFYKQDDRFFLIPHDMGLSDRTDDRGFNLLIENKIIDIHISFLNLKIFKY